MSVELNFMVKKMIRVSAAAFGLLALVASAVAAQDTEPNLDFEASLGITNDYRDRGFSLSDKDFSVFGSVNIFHKSGLYGGMIVATVDDPDERNFKGDFYVGWSQESDGYIYDLSVEIGSMVGGPRDRIYPEFQASVARDYGLAFFKTGVAWAPDGRWTSPDNDTFYGYLDGEIPVPNLPLLTVLTHVGYDVRGERRNLWDWSLGVSAFIKNTEFTVSYEDSSSRNPIASGAVIFSLRQYF